jgi:hypothetical protein
MGTAHWRSSRVDCPVIMPTCKSFKLGLSIPKHIGLALPNGACLPDF